MSGILAFWHLLALSKFINSWISSINRGIWQVINVIVMKINIMAVLSSARLCFRLLHDSILILKIENKSISLNKKRQLVLACSVYCKYYGINLNLLITYMNLKNLLHNVGRSSHSSTLLCSWEIGCNAKQYYKRPNILCHLHTMVQCEEYIVHTK